MLWWSSVTNSIIPWHHPVILTIENNQGLPLEHCQQLRAVLKVPAKGVKILWPSPSVVLRVPAKCYDLPPLLENSLIDSVHLQPFYGGCNFLCLVFIHFYSPAFCWPPPLVEWMVQIDHNDGSLPFHRLTNGWLPLKNHGVQWLPDQKPSQNHRAQWLPD